MKKTLHSKNRLAEENSPYLLQHADNPVNWYPWGEEAFTKAHSEDKLIFLSIGYSTCHWCHVMEKESFEDEEVAALMNRVFVSIKVDREERPDIDAIYMDAAMMLNGNGGWPLNLVVTPDRKPIFAATYIPKEGTAYHGGMLTIIPQIEKAWQTRKDELIESGNKIAKVLQTDNSGITGQFQPKNIDDTSYQIYKQAFSILQERFDEENGGFGDRPKFPQPHNLLFLLRYYHTYGDNYALDMLTKTLDSMRASGIFDHIGFGFHRYATDKVWKVPHFEKMLYDQAMLLLAYAETYLVTGNMLYKKTGEEIVAYVLRDLQSPQGAFYSAEDADSEGVEGKYYLWDYGEFNRLAGPQGGKYRSFFHLEEEGNFTDVARGTKTGKNILYADPDAVGNLEGREWEAVRKNLLSYREERIRPEVDDKILTDWNGLMIYALARAAWIFDNQQYYAAARKAADFFLSEMKQPDNGLFHSYREGESGSEGLLDDYAFFGRALLELYKSGFEPRYLEEAVSCIDFSLEYFEDKKGGGFYLTRAGAENLLVRKKILIDNAIPAGNSIMLESLQQLYTISGKEKYRKASEGIITAAIDTLRTYPQAAGMMICGLFSMTGNTREIVLVGKEDELTDMIGVVQQKLMPGSVVLVKTEKTAQEIGKIAPGITRYPMPEAGTAAYVCENFSCRTPVFTSDALNSMVSSS